MTKRWRGDRCRMGEGDVRRHNNFTEAKFERKMFLQCQFLGQVATLFTVCQILLNNKWWQCLFCVIAKNKYNYLLHLINLLQFLFVQHNKKKFLVCRNKVKQNRICTQSAMRKQLHTTAPRTHSSYLAHTFSGENKKQAQIASP